MEWEGKTIYDFLNFAKDEAVKINVIRKEMELELERIKMIGKETEVDNEEVMKSVYIARDSDDNLYMHLSRPYRKDGSWVTYDCEHFDLENVDIKLPFVTWESEPLEYRILETEVEEKITIKNKSKLDLQFVPELHDLMREYGVFKITPLSMNSYITQNTINGFNFYNGEE